MAGEFLTCKGTTIADYRNFIKEAGHRGDELTVYLLACMVNFAIIVSQNMGFGPFLMVLSMKLMWS